MAEVDKTNGAGAVAVTTENATTPQEDTVMIDVLLDKMESLHKLQRDYHRRGEYITLDGVLREVIRMGIAARNHYWDAAEKGKEVRELGQLAKQLGIRTREQLADLLKQRGIT